MSYAIAKLDSILDERRDFVVVAGVWMRHACYAIPLIEVV